MKNQFLVGKRVYLRPLEFNDLNGNYPNWLNDPEVTKQNSHHTYPYSKVILEDYITNAYSSKDKLPLAIIDKENEITKSTIESIELIKQIQESNGEKGCHRYIISNNNSSINIRLV